MRYRLAVFDIDGTLTKHISSWQYIHERFGLWNDQAAQYQDQFFRGQIDYRRFCELDAALWKGTPEKKVRRLFTRRLYTRNAVKTLRKLKKDGFSVALISTGLQYMAELIKKDTGADIIITNRLNSSDGFLTGKVQVNIGLDEKGKKLLEVMEKLSVKKVETVCVGDGSGDVPMADNSGYAIAFNSSDPEYLAKADYVCLTRNFSEVYRQIKHISSGE
ncbi:MAG: HAD family phosphatase [Elusimicrobia bacterium]|nr:HAD family phosphatase [Elusimicrobiota bacterium]